MKKQFFLFVALVMGVGILSAQTVNNYSYVIVPHHYSFLKEADKYRLNSLTRFLFKKEGFKVVYDNETFPQDLATNPCLGLRAEVLNGGGMFKTKLTIKLTDCRNKEVFSSKEGTSREKEFEKGFHEALREAFKSVKELNYQYEPIEENLQVTEIKKPKVAVRDVPVVEKRTAVKNLPATDIVKASENGTSETVAVTKETTAIVKKAAVVIKKDEALKAQWVSLGYEVKNASGAVVMQLLMTPKKDIYMVKDSNAILYKNEKGGWLFVENDGANMSTKVLNISFGD